MRRFTTVVAAAIAVAVASSAAEPKPVRLFAEAEDFTVDAGDGGWKVVPYGENYYAATFAICFLSRKACLGAPAQGRRAVATREIVVPTAGEYQLAARYEQPYNFSVEFAVEIVQGGKLVCRRAFGRLTDPKIWAFNGHKRTPMQRYSWGGTDNIVWQIAGGVKLAAGPATIRLIAAAQTDGGRPRKMAAKRHVDVLCLTNDTAGLAVQKAKARYLEMDGWLVQDGDLYVRFTNPRDGLGPCVPVVQPFFQGQHSPYYVHVRDWPTTRVVKGGRIVDKTAYRIAGPRSRQVKGDLLAPLLEMEKVPEDRYLAPGETSGWVPMGQVLDALNNCIWQPAAIYKGRKKGSQLDLELEFAVPDGKGGLRAVRKLRVKGPASFEIPGNVAARPLIRTQLEALQWLTGEIARFPKRGRPPKRFSIYGLMEFSGATRQDTEIGKLATKLAIALGDNTLTPLRGPWAERLGVPQRRAGLVAHWRPGNFEQFKKTADNADKKGQLGHIGIVSYGDEVHIPPAKPDDAKFAKWLAARGVRVQGEVTFTADRGAPLYYYSRVWAIEEGIRHYAEATRWLEKRIGPHVLTGANYSPHANYLVTDLQWVRPFKMRGMTMPWSEDYVCQIPETSVQVVGYLVSAFRCGAKYRRMPIMMYVMPHYPNGTPRDFRLSFYTCVAHGATKINYFCASPMAVGATENYIATDGLEMWRAVSDTTHDAGVFEDYVMDGRVRPAKVALLLSSVDEIMTGDTNFAGAIHNAERKAVYYALRHAQVPVDFLTEDDVIDGRARDYLVIYVTQQYLHSKAVAALIEWAKAGGTVVALCGGGFLNEFGKPNPQAEKLYGAKGLEILKDPKITQILAKQDLPPMKLLDTVKTGQTKDDIQGLEVLAWKQKLTLAGGEATATFSDGSVAAVEKRHGKGRAMLIGFLPGLAYLKSGLPLRPVDRGATNDSYAHFLPTECDAKVRRCLVDDLLPTGFVRPVTCSVDMVETTCIDTPGPPRLAVPVMNYTGKPIPNLTVTVHSLASAKTVRSVVRGTLKPTFEAGAMTVRLRLDVADMLLIDR